MKWVFVACVVSLALPLTVPLLGQESNSAAPVVARFTATWKEDVSKRKVGDLVHLRFQKNTQGGLEELRGPEAKPVVQPVVFDGKPRETGSGNTIVWKQTDANTFDRVLSKAGETLTVRRIRISPDGKTLTQVEESKTTDGSPAVSTVVYQRVSGDEQGLVGRWKPTSFKADTPAIWKIEPFGTNGLKWSGSGGQNYNVMLDGTSAPINGPAVLRGTMVAAKLKDGQTIEFTNSRESIDTGKSVWTLSADGKMLTVIDSSLGTGASKDSTTLVFVKQ